MYCPKCGIQFPDNAQFCNKCGSALSRQSAAPQNVSPTPYTPYQNVYQPQYGQYSQQNMVIPVSALIAAAFIVLAILTIWLNWLTVEVSYSGASSGKDFNFTDIMDIDEEYVDYSGKLDGYSPGSSSVIPESRYDEISDAFYAMKYCALAGYIVLGVAAVSLFVSRKFGAVLAAISMLLFIAALIFNILYCTRTMDIMDDIYRVMFSSRYNIDCDIKPGLGCILALAASAGAAVSLFITAFRRKSYPASVYPDF